MISLDMSLEEMPGDRKVICRGRQVAGMCQGQFVPLTQLDLGPVWPHPLLVHFLGAEETVPYACQGTDEVVELYLLSAVGGGSNYLDPVRAVLPGQGSGVTSFNLILLAIGTFPLHA